MNEQTQAKTPDGAAVGAQVDRGVRPPAGPNVRRMLRAARLCEELGHAGDTLAALEELQALRTGMADERTRLRALQATAVMPLIGPLMDAWECCSQSVRSEHPELDKHLRRINRAMEDAGDERPNVAIKPRRQASA